MKNPFPKPTASQRLIRKLAPHIRWWDIIQLRRKPARRRIVCSYSGS